MYYFVNNKNTARFAHVLWDFIYFFLLHCVQFCNETEKCQLEKSLKYFSISQPMKIMLDLNMSHRKMFDFVSFLLFGFTLVTKLRNFDFESHWNISCALIKKVSDLNMSHGKMSDFVSLLLLGFTFVIKLRNFNFKGHYILLIIFDKKYDIRFDYALSSSVWFVLSFIVWVKFWQ